MMFCLFHFNLRGANIFLDNFLIRRTYRYMSLKIEARCRHYAVIACSLLAPRSYLVLFYFLFNRVAVTFDIYFIMRRHI